MAENYTIRNDHSAEVMRKVQEALYDALDLCGQQAVRNAAINLEHDPRRVDTGLLRNSITYAHSGESPAISSYKGNNASRFNPDGPIPSGSYSGTAPNEGETVYIGTNVEYGIYVHEGTQHMSPNHFLRDAVQGHEDEYAAICKRIFGKIT